MLLIVNEREKFIGVGYEIAGEQYNTYPRKTDSEKFDNRYNVDKNLLPIFLKI